MQRAERAYTSNSLPIKSESQIEYEAFARISRQLVIKEKTKKADFSGFVKALDENRHLWRILAIDVADANNSLSKELRAQIFYLAEFTDSYTRQILQENAPVEALTDINVAIMRGLSARGKAS
jgi:flagellar protein FlaF